MLNKNNSKSQNSIHKEMEKTFKELILLLSSIRQEQLNIIPFEGSWTAGQVARHLIKSWSGFVQLINGPVKDTNDREPDEKTKVIKEDQLDFSTKNETSAIIYPEEVIYSKEKLLKILLQLSGELNHALVNLDNSKTCLLFELPVYGFLTRLEAFYFVTYHTQRHIHQLRTIYRKVRMKSLVERSEIRYNAGSNIPEQA